MKVTENGVLQTIEGKKLWFCRIIASGLGSSAYYPSTALEETGANAFPIGSHVHADHQSWREWDEQPANSVKTIIGVVASTPSFHKVGETVTVAGEQRTIEVEGLYAHFEFLEEWAPFVEQIREFVGLSINAQVTIAEGSEHPSGLPIVESFLASPLNTVDLVTVPGADGRIISAAESAIVSGKIKREVREELGMTPEEIEALAGAITKAVVPAITEALTPEQEIVEEVDVSALSEAMIEAELPKAARVKVYEAVTNGAVLEEAITAEKDYIAGITEGLKVEQEGVLKESQTKAEDYSITGWSK